MLIESTILVESVAGSDRVGVRRDTDGDVWLASWSDLEPEGASGLCLEGLEPERVFEREWFGAGGLLPAGVRRAEVRAPDGAWHQADVGDGAWSAIVPCPLSTEASLMEVVFLTLPVRFLDARGSIVSRVTPEMAAASRRVGLLETLGRRLGPFGLPASCPVCGGRTWRATADARGSGERIFCRACGHDEHGGSDDMSRLGPRTLAGWFRGRKTEGPTTHAFGFPPGQPPSIDATVRADLDHEGVPRVNVEVTNRLSEPNDVVACGVNITDTRQPSQIERVAVRLVDTLAGERFGMAAGATIVLSHAFDPDQLRVLACLHELPAEERPSLGAWVQARDGGTIFTDSVDAHARWRELGWVPDQF